MELGGKLLNSLRIKTQFFERLQREIVVDGAAHTQKDDVESNGVSLECCKGLCASPPLFCVFGVSFHPPGFLLRLLSCAPSTLYSTWVLFFNLVSFLWFWVSLSSFLLLSPLLEPSLLFFLLSVRSLLGAVAVTPPQKKKKTFQATSNLSLWPGHPQLSRRE